MIISRIRHIFFLYLICMFPAAAFAQSIDFQALIKQTEKQPEQVFYQIESLLISSDLSLESQAKLFVIQSEIAYFIDRPEHIIEYSEKALSSGLLDNNWHVKALIIKARGHYQKREYPLFLVTAKMAVQKAEQFSLAGLKTSALIERAFAYIFADKKTLAEDDLKLAQRYLSVMPSIFSKAILLERFASVKNLLGQYAQAINKQTESIETFQKNNNVHFLSIAFYNLSRIYRAKEDMAKAIMNMELSYRWAIKDNNKLNQAFSLSRLSEYQLEQGNAEQARKSLKLAISAADESQSTRVQFLARKDLALVNCSTTINNDCHASLSNAIAFAERHDMKTDKNELTRILAEKQFNDKQFEQAYLTLKSTIENK